MVDAGLKDLLSTLYQKNSLPKMMEGKAYSRCLRAVLLTDSALHFTLLSSKEHEGEQGQIIFEATDTFDESGHVHDGNIFETLEGIDETIFDEYVDSEEEKSIADKLQELKNISLMTLCSFLMTIQPKN